MTVEITNIGIDATLNPGSGENKDIVNVSIMCSGAQVNISVPLPTGTIVQDVKKAQQSAYEQAVEILAQLSDAARKEALL